MNEPNIITIDQAVAPTAIRAENCRIGLKVSQSDEAAMAHRLASALRGDPETGRTYLVDDNGNF